MSASLRDGRPDAYFAADLRERLATDPRVAAPGLDVTVAGDTVHVRGRWPGEDCTEAVRQVLAEHAPDHRLDVQVECIQLGEPDPGHEEAVS